MSVTPAPDEIKPFESQSQFGPSLIFTSEEFIHFIFFGPNKLECLSLANLYGLV